MTSAKRAEHEFRHQKPPRIPRMVAYQTKGQLPLTMLALIVIATGVFAYWVLTV